jgi:hypothetical protein
MPDQPEEPFVGPSDHPSDRGAHQPPTRKRTLAITAAVGVAGLVAGGLGATALSSASASADDGNRGGFGTHGGPGYGGPPGMQQGSGQQQNGAPSQID